jgi:hypothetical protein
MRAIVTSFLLAVMVVAALFEAGPRQAWACSCMVFPSDAQTARERLEWPWSDAVVLGVVEKRMGSDLYPEARIRTERVYKGHVSKAFDVTSGNCNGIIADFKQGQRWLMELHERDGGWQTGGCGAGVADAGGDAAAWADALGHTATVSLPPAGRGHDGLSLPVAALIAVSLGTLTLTAVYLTERRARTNTGAD